MQRWNDDLDRSESVIDLNVKLHFEVALEIANDSSLTTEQSWMRKLIESSFITTETNLSAYIKTFYFFYVLDTLQAAFITRETT